MGQQGWLPGLLRMAVWMAVRGDKGGHHQRRRGLWASHQHLTARAFVIRRPHQFRVASGASNGMCLHVLSIGPLLPHNAWMSFGIFLASSGFISPPLAIGLRPGMPKMKQATRNPYK